jgi:hypothetical protein
MSGTEIVPSLVPTSTEFPVISSPTPGLSVTRPEWMADEDSNILLLSYSGLVLFIDPKTADILFLNLPNASWIDNSRVIFSSTDQIYRDPSERIYQYVFDLKDWKINSNPDQNSGTDIGTKYYPDIWLDRGDANTPIKVYNDQLEEWEVFLYPPQGLYNLYEIYVDNEIFVIQGGDAYGSGQAIAVYDYETKQMLRTFTGSVEMNTLQYSEGKVVYVTENVPCAIDVQTLDRECGLPIPEKYKKIAIGSTLVYPETIPFTYEEHIEEYAYTRRLCLFSFFTGKMICPTEDLQILKPVISTIKDWEDPSKQMEIIESRSVGSYSISPDGKYVVFCYVSNYYARYEGTAIIDVDGGDFHILDEVEFVPDFLSNICSRGGVPVDFKWRPLPQK